MRLEAYNPEFHKPYLEQLLMSRDMPLLSLDALPSKGFIALEGYSIIAAGFLNVCEGATAFLDCYITHLKQPAFLRDEALDMITAQLVETAKSLEIKRLLAFSVDENTITRAEAHGFRVFPHVFAARNIE